MDIDQVKRGDTKRDPASMVVIPRINTVWALDSMHDALYGGRSIRILNAIDEADRSALGIDVAVSIPASRVIRFVEQLIDIHGRPRAIGCDNGTELTSQAFTERMSCSSNPP